MRSLRLICLILALAAAAGSCGLPTVATALIPPGAVVTQTNANPFTIISSIAGNTANVEDEFRGYELYYRFYLAPPIPIDFTTSVTFDYPAALMANGFLPVVTTSPPDNISGTVIIHSKPLIGIPILDRGTDYQVQIAFPPLGTQTQPSTTYKGNPFSLSIRRDVVDTDGSHVAGYNQGKPFITFVTYQVYLVTDQDISAIFTAASGQGSAYLALYVMSYGLADQDLYSPPVYLGYVQVTIPQ